MEKIEQNIFRLERLFLKLNFVFCGRASFEAILKTFLKNGQLNAFWKAFCTLTEPFKGNEF